MGAAFSVVEQRPGYATVLGGPPEDVVFIGIVVHPQETYVEFPITDAAYKLGATNAAASSWAAIIEGIWALDWVVGVQWSQIVNPSNQLVSVLIVTVSSTSGDSTANTTINFVAGAPQEHPAQIAALHNTLDTTEDL